LGGWSTPDVIFDGSADTGSMYAGLLTRLEVGN
jgi:hypothetical protein